jgi:hypothetical protein
VHGPAFHSPPVLLMASPQATRALDTSAWTVISREVKLAAPRMAGRRLRASEADPTTQEEVNAESQQG